MKEKVMEAIFLVKDMSKVNSVYKRDAVVQNLRELLPINIYTKQDVENNSGLFRNVKYIFSTWYMPEFEGREVKKYFPALEAVFYAAGTVKYFAEPFLKNDVRVFSAAKANAIPVAEFAVAQILLANKGYFQAQRTYRKPYYSFSFKKARNFADNKNGNYNAKIGIIGVGAVGRKVIELLKSYRLEILVTDPYIAEDDLQSMGVKKVELSELFHECNVISNHLPDIPETKGMLNYSLFSLMKPETTFINTGRGAQIIERDLLRALREKSERCALLDVASHEPIWPWSALNRMRNVFITPHIAGSIGKEEERMAEYMFQAYQDYINGKKSPYEVNSEMLKTMA